MSPAEIAAIREALDSPEWRMESDWDRSGATAADALRRSIRRNACVAAGRNAVARP